MGFKDIEYDIPVYHLHYIYITFTTSFFYIYVMATSFFYIYKSTERPVVLLNAIFNMDMAPTFH